MGKNPETSIAPNTRKTTWYAEQAAYFGNRAMHRHYDFSIVGQEDQQIRADVARLARVAAHFGNLALRRGHSIRKPRGTQARWAKYRKEKPSAR